MTQILFGCTGRLARIDLTQENSKYETITEESARKFFGGRGLGARILFHELKPGIDPLGPDNKMVFATGQLQERPSRAIADML